MRVVIVEDRPGEVDELGQVGANDALSKAFAQAKRVILKGRVYGQVRALGELEDLVTKHASEGARALVRDLAREVLRRDA